MPELPKCMYEKNGGYYLVKHNRWLFLGRNLDLAVERYAELTSGVPPDYYLATYRRARGNAVGRRLEFLLSESEFQSIVSRAGGACEVTRIPFTLDNPTRSKRRPFAPSLDRIDCRLPYTVSNCRLVAVCINAAMSDWGEYVVRTILTLARP
ncbi:MAG TPA: hypothetical protein VKQ31_06970, partial [Steroidobacteraceae bacterium]|nr:hypothetical protein [Steroidobacteraceae bacterium]